MKILWKGFCGKQHSWSICAQNISRSFKKYNHDLDLFSTNGIEHFPEDLKENLLGYYVDDKVKIKDKIVNKRKIVGEDVIRQYDMQLSYSAMNNWSQYLSHGKKNRFGIWNYDGSIIPNGWAKYYKFSDMMLPSSEFSKNVFLKNGVPQQVMKVIPHGVNEEFLVESNSKYEIKTDRKYKFLINIAQLHTRKNIDGILNAWGEAFTNFDDVVLIAKLNIKKPFYPFEVNWNELFLNFKKKYQNHAPVIIINEFISNIADLYRACDIHLSLSHVECFHIPSLESMMLGKITIASNYGGNVDFMNKENSLLVDGKICRAPLNYQYWEPTVQAEMFQPDLKHAVELMRLAVSDYDNLSNKFKHNLSSLKDIYTWDNVAKQILELSNEI